MALKELAIVSSTASYRTQQQRILFSIILFSFLTKIIDMYLDDQWTYEN